MQTFTYSCQSELAIPARKAAQQWNNALAGLCRLMPVPAFADIQIEFGPVDRSEDESRIAQCTKFENKNIKRWRITLANDLVWKTWSNWYFWRKYDEDAVAALLHEFGHALGFNHSDVYSDVMHPKIGSTVISKEEEVFLREKFDCFNDKDLARRALDSE